MNHLAHLHLAAPARGALVGALLADYHKGPLDGRLPAEVEQGIRLHRRIDAFTDSHPVVRELRRLFRPPARRLAGIVLDLHFDLLLSRHWGRFHELPLADFCAGALSVLDDHRELFPPAGRRYLVHLRERELLRRYGDERVVEGALQHLGARLGQESAMRLAADTARARLDRLEQGFLTLYPEARIMASGFARSA